jgi:bacillithiol synthase
MEILNLSLPATNKFATDYLAGASEIQNFFHYQYQVSSEYKKRLDELQSRSFMRKEVASCIEAYMERFPQSKEVSVSIEKLKKDNSAVIIGGQQAGILTGPLYSIHKIISIISLAKQKEAELNIPVVPVFWIAGEDHDYQEVNHIYIEKDQKVEKMVYPEKVIDKKMVSDIAINKEICYGWIETLFETFGETQFTNDVLHFMKKGVSQSDTFVDFFAYIVMELFKEYGLLVIDSGYSGIRKLEKEIFISQIKNASQITAAVKAQQQKLAEVDLENTIEISDEAANIFYYDEEFQERILLQYDFTNRLFAGKNGLVSFTEDELLQIAAEFPEKLSNNVVTRPMTQETLFPTLAFIAGPGEVAYWAELKMAFEEFGMKMPPIVPRLNITILERSLETDINELQLNIKEVLTSGIKTAYDQYIESIKDHELERLFQQTKNQIQENYRLIEGKMLKGLLPLLEKNEEILLKQVEFMESKTEAILREGHQVVINKYTRVENHLRPLGSPQERMLNAIYYLNRYGLQFFSEMTNLSFEFDGLHKVIRI